MRQQPKGTGEEKECNQQYANKENQFSIMRKRKVRWPEIFFSTQDDGPSTQTGLKEKDWS